MSELLLATLGLSKNIEPVEEFKRCSAAVKKETFKRTLKVILERLETCTFRESVGQNINHEDLGLRIIVRKYCGILFRCLDDDLAEDEVPTVEEEAAWMATDKGFDIDDIMSRLVTEPLSKAVEDVKTLLQILESSVLDKFIYVKR